MKKLSRIIYRFFRRLVLIFYPKITFEGLDKLPEEPCIIVGNHSQMNGPIIGELFFPGKRAMWCAGEMMELKSVPAYAYKDFWSYKPKYIRWFYKLLSYIIAPLSVCLFNEAHTIGVYRDMRVVSTFKHTLNALKDGTNIIIFPECYTPHNNIVYEFQNKFIDVAKLYYKSTGKGLSFAPMYIAPKLKKVCIGEGIMYDGKAEASEERQRISNYLMDTITEMAVNLPGHTVVPYANLPKKDYPLNVQPEENKNMKKPVVDYRKFRFSKLNDPEFSHLKYLLGWVGYFVFYVITERFIPLENCHIIHCALDDKIVFNELFLIPYCSWYVFIVGSLLHFLLYDIDSFKKLQTYIIITQIIAMTVYIVYPNAQLMRPEQFARDNVLTRLMAFIYSFDTCTGVCPSLHVAYSFGMASVWTKYKNIPLTGKILIYATAIIISISTTFVKQHSFVDVVAAIPVILVAELIVYGKYYFRKKSLQA